MMLKKRGVLSLILIMIMTLGTVVFASAAAKKKVVHVWHTEANPQVVKAMDEIIKDFEKLHPDIKVEQEPLSWSDIEVKLSGALAAGNPPELTQVISPSGYSFYKTGLLRPLDDVVNDIGKDDIFKFIRDRHFYGGHWMGLAHSTGAQTIIYRKDLFEQKGIKPPKTWDEFVQAAKALTEDTDGDGKIDQWGVSFPVPATFISYWMDEVVGSNGGRMVDKNQRPTLTEKEVIESLNFLKKLVPYFPPGWSGHGYYDTYINLAKGKAAMLWFGWGRGVYQVERRADPSIADPQHFGVMMNPVGPSGKEPKVGRDGEPWMIFKNSKYPEEAAEFLKFFYKKENYIKYCHAIPTHLLPIIKSVSESPEYRDNPMLKKWSDWVNLQLQEISSGYASDALFEKKPYTREIPFVLQLTTSGIIADMVFDVLKENVPAEKAAAKAQKRAEELITSLGYKTW